MLCACVGALLYVATCQGLLAACPAGHARQVLTCWDVMQADMLQRKRKQFDESIQTLHSWDGFVDALNNKKMVMTPWYAALVLPSHSCLIPPVGMIGIR